MREPTGPQKIKTPTGAYKTPEPAAEQKPKSSTGEYKTATPSGESRIKHPSAAYKTGETIMPPPSASSTSLLAEPKITGKGRDALWLTATYLVGMLLIFFGERTVFEWGKMRLLLDFIGALALIVSVSLRANRLRAITGKARRVELYLLGAYVGGILALVLYAAQSDLLLDHLRPLFGNAKSLERYQVALSAIWPALWLCSILPLIQMELSYSSMDVLRTVEPERVKRSAQSALIISMSLSFVFLFNYISNEFNRKVDLSYFKTTRPSEPSQKMVQGLSEPVKAYLFFQTGSEVEPMVTAYFQELSRQSPQFTVQYADQQLDPVLAKELGATENGVVVLQRGKQTQLLTIGQQLNAAKSKLRKLDGEFQNSFYRLMRTQKVAYLTVGHEELAKAERNRLEGQSVRDLRLLLEKMNFSVREIGVGSGLASEIPLDATLVIITGPRKEFLTEEVGTLKRYVQRGGKVMVFLDPQGEAKLTELLGTFGLKFTPEILANDKMYARTTQTPADKQNIYTNRYSTHPSVSTLSRNSREAATILPLAGYLEEIPSTAGLKPQVQFTLHAMPGTFNDLNKNFEFDESEGEKRKDFELAAVVTIKADKAAEPKPQDSKDAKDKKKKIEENEGQMIIVANADMISDRLLRYPGNAYLLLDSIKWMTGDEE